MSAGGYGGRATVSGSAIAALQAALAAEYAAIYSYGVAGAHLGGQPQQRALTAWNAHRARRDQLIEMIAASGGQPVAAAAAYQLPFPVTSARAAVTLATTLEDGVTRAFLALVAASDRAIRTFGALAMQDSAVRAAQWRDATVAFPGLPHGATAWQPSPAADRGTLR